MAYQIGYGCPAYKVQDAGLDFLNGLVASILFKVKLAQDVAGNEEHSLDHAGSRHVYCNLLSKD